MVGDQDDLGAKIEAQGDTVRKLKADKADKSKVTKAFHNIVFEELSKDTESPPEFLWAKHPGKSERLKEEKGADLCERSAIKEQYTVGFLFLSQNPRPKGKQGTQTFFKEQSLILRVRETS